MLKRIKKQHQDNIDKTKKVVKLDTLKNLKIAKTIDAVRGSGLSDEMKTAIMQNRLLSKL